MGDLADFFFHGLYENLLTGKFIHGNVMNKDLLLGNVTFSDCILNFRWFQEV